MTKPRIGDLLNGVAASLRESVLPGIPAGPPRRQAQMAIAIIRRIAAVWDKVGPYLLQDNVDIEATLRRVCDILDRSGEAGPAVISLRQTLAAIDRESSTTGEYPSIAELEERNVELQRLLIEIQETLNPGTPGPAAGRIAGAEHLEIDRILRALFRRMLEREAAITAPVLSRNH